MQNRAGVRFEVKVRIDFCTSAHTMLKFEKLQMFQKNEIWNPIFHALFIELLRRPIRFYLSLMRRRRMRVGVEKRRSFVQEA